MLKLTPADAPPAKKPKNHRKRLRQVIQNASLIRASVNREHDYM
ncbi:MAG: hypothetical protein AVDCRST_MAG80-2360 [uncultured Rubrobacteraceae bacterium]|uniref:Uncharacterized protein n=1 Tax=uncultured Rubrobacteraceae bacterium TaxID=349277 RepID=A0A6J4QWS0_9ACTN|nr:MAG: hypothetical protein AVDCRST_MAG80-2360 [uncultured Rubrobacteraceae bacterium]